MISPEQVNSEIINCIENKTPSIFGKIGGIESSHLAYYLTHNRPALVRGNTLFVNAGIYVETEEQLKLWCDSYLNAVKNTDYMLQWCPEQGDELVINNVWQGKFLFNEFKGLEPFFMDEGWHKKLEDKTLLSVGPFKDTVLSQSEKYKDIWNCEIGNTKAVRTPYPEALTGEPPVLWSEKLDYIFEELSSIGEFDVATVGAGGFSLLICDFIKKMGKPCIHLGGGNQLLFGISGGRWDNSEKFINSSWYNTKCWTRPFKHETPSGKNLVENGCYW